MQPLPFQFLVSNHYKCQQSIKGIRAVLTVRSCTQATNLEQFLQIQICDRVKNVQDTCEFPRFLRVFHLAITKILCCHRITTPTPKSKLMQKGKTHHISSLVFYISDKCSTDTATLICSLTNIISVKRDTFS